LEGDKEGGIVITIARLNMQTYVSTNVLIPNSSCLERVAQVIIL